MTRTLSLRQLYSKLLESYGPQYWWPAETPFEMMVGSILTQVTAWHNAALAIAQLKSAGLLTPEALDACPLDQISTAIQPAGFFNQKALRLKRFTRWYLERYEGKIELLRQQDGNLLRQELLELSGIGPETADCIVLYAAQHPVFVVDAYTRRILGRHGIVDPKLPYAAYQKECEKIFCGNACEYNELHALIVETGKRYCFKKQPNCESCPLGDTPYTIEEG